MIPLVRKKTGSEDEMTSNAGKGGRYRRREPPSPSVAEYISSGIVRKSTAVRRSVASPKSIRSHSVPSLHALDAKAKFSPPDSPSRKPRSRSVRINATKKTLSFKKIKKIFGSHSELEAGGRVADVTENVGTYRPLGISRPRSIGGSSDCSNSSLTQSDFSRNNSMRESSRSRISHGGNDSVFSVRQASYDSADYTVNHVATGSTDSQTLRPYTIQYMQRSNSSSSLKMYGVQTRVDPRYHPMAATPSSSADPDMSHRKQRTSGQRNQPVTSEDTESWEESQSFILMNNRVVPSDPEYAQIAHDLMSASPTRTTPTEFQTELRRISESSVGDPRRASNDSGVESSSTKPNRSLPSTPIAQSFTSVRNGETSSPDPPTVPHDHASSEDSHSLPSGWDLATTQTGIKYYLDHNTRTTHWKLPEEDDNTVDLPPGWEVVRSIRYGTYYVNHNNKTAIYQHPCHLRPPPPYHRPPCHYLEEEEQQTRDRKPPARSHSHRSTQTQRVLDPNASLPRRSKSFKDPDAQDHFPTAVSHERQMSTMTYVPPSPYQIAEIPQWLREYVDAPPARDTDIQWDRCSYDELSGLDTMIKRMLKKNSEQIVKQYEYYRVALQQEIDMRLKERAKEAALQPREFPVPSQPPPKHPQSSHEAFPSSSYPRPPLPTPPSHRLQPYPATTTVPSHYTPSHHHPHYQYHEQYAPQVPLPALKMHRPPNTLSGRPPYHRNSVQQGVHSYNNHSCGSPIHPSTSYPSFAKHLPFQGPPAERSTPLQPGTSNADFLQGLEETFV